MSSDPTHMKQCCTCKAWHPVTEFNKRARASDGLQSRCRSCSREWYLAHRDEHVRNVTSDKARRMADARDGVLAHLRTHPCVDCGETDVCVLEFDHVRGVKAANIAQLMNTGAPWDEIEAEIAKCDVRCCSCHRRVTLRRKSAWRTSDHDCESRPTIVLDDDLEALLDSAGVDWLTPEHVAWLDRWQEDEAALLRMVGRQRSAN